MSRSEAYKGYGWIKVQRHKDDKSLPLEDRLESLQKHHIEETTFLIDEVRKLASEIDVLKSSVSSLSSKLEACHQLARRAFLENDAMPYEE